MMKQREARKIGFYGALLLLAVIVAVMIWGTMIAKIPTAIAIFYCMLISAVWGKVLGHRWEEMFTNVLDVVKTAMPAVYFLLLVGFISSSWIASGTIPYMIYLGLKTIHPSIFLFSAFLITGISSMATGTSWSIVTSLGLAMAGIAVGLGVPMPLAAGAIVGGCFLGDKWSPLSDTPNLAAAATGQDVMKLFAHMKWTSGLSAVLGGLTFLIIGFLFQGEGADVTAVTTLLDGLSSHYHFTPLLLLPIAFVLITGYLKLPILPMLAISVVIAMGEAMLFQGKTFVELSNIVWTGYVASTSIAPIDSLLSRGGVMSVTSLIMLLFSAFTFAGVIERVGVLEAIMSRLLYVIKSDGMLIMFTVLSSIAGVFLSSSVYVSMILNGRMYMSAYQKHNLEMINLTRATNEGAAYMGAMVPWSGGALLASSALGISTWAYFPFVFPAWFAIGLTILLGYLGKATPHVAEAPELEGLVPEMEIV